MTTIEFVTIEVADIGAAERYGVDVAKSYGRKYVEMDTSPVKLTLYQRRALARVAGVPADRAGSHRLIINADAGDFTDPDGFAWESVRVPTSQSEAPEELQRVTSNQQQTERSYDQP